jgi:hypothetical protein
MKRKTDKPRLGVLIPKREAVLERKRAAAVAELERAEGRLHRAFTRWSKARAAVRRHELECAKTFAADDGGGRGRVTATDEHGRPLGAWETGDDGRHHPAGAPFDDALDTDHTAGNPGKG